MIYQQVSFGDFRDAFRKHDRLETFSYEGARALFDYLEQGEDWELDVIALCCEFAEASIDQIIDDYLIDVSDCEDETDKHATVSDYLHRNTLVIGETGNNSYLFQQF